MTPPGNAKFKDERDEAKKTFSTRDLYLASTLVTLQFVLMGTDFQVEGVKPKPIGYFNFEDSPALRDAILQYNQGMIMVEPRMFINNLQSLKAIVTNMFQNPNSKYNTE